MAAVNPPPVAPPAQPSDPLVQPPVAPGFPPTMNNVLEAVRYRQIVDISLRRPIDAPGIRCTLNDRYHAVLYEHGVISQATAAAGPQAAAPPWFQAAMHQFRNDIRNDIRGDIIPDLKQVINQSRDVGDVTPFEIVPFANGE